MFSDVDEQHTSCVVVYFQVYTSARQYVLKIGIAIRSFLQIFLRLHRLVYMQPLSSKLDPFVNILYHHISYRHSPEVNIFQVIYMYIYIYIISKSAI